MKKNAISWSAIALAIIIIGAVFLRTYEFNDWLYFKMDQSRDALLISNAVENGPGYLPLLGARAGAVELEKGFLRLGPIFYYFQYAAGVLFHSTEPYVYAYPDLLFSILAIPLLYLFARLYFSEKNSLLIAAMYAFSFIIIQYSRFAWNPNSLQFFLLLSFYGLLKFLGETHSGRKKWWLAVWAAGITVGSQLHFFGFFSLLGISGLLIITHFQLWKKANILYFFQKNVLKKIAVYTGILAMVFAIFYAPVIISDVRKGGENTKNFFEALTAKPVKKPLVDKIGKSAKENLKYYCLITTSQCYSSNSKNDLPAVMATGLVLLSGLVLAVRGLLRKGRSVAQRDFLALLIIWVGVFTILTIPVSFQLRPRFFIVVFAIPFVFLGLMFEYLEEKLSRKQALVASILLATGIIGWNSQGTYAWFQEQAASQKGDLAVKRTLILKAKDGVTLGQLKGVTDWMYARHKAGMTLYYYVKPEHVRPIEFLLWQKHDKGLIFKTLSLNEDANAQFFAVVPAENGLEPAYKKYGKNISIIAQKQFGQLAVYEIDFNDRITSPEFRFNKRRSKTDRVFWKDVVSIDDGREGILIDGTE
ncbi:MAG: phospholipid carrier-dependent glycosyltransferase [Candidatus Moranbacteria bacterium]|nr:phospholipid carrier-dependent glycosyltransferase [Candidatus Moranbacteria bacterium]